MEAPWGDAGLRRLALLLALACGLLAGCGGDDAADGPLSKAEYEKRFNVVIQESEKRGQRLGPRSPSRARSWAASWTAPRSRRSG